MTLYVPLNKMNRFHLYVGVGINETNFNTPKATQKIIDNSINWYVHPLILVCTVAFTRSNVMTNAVADKNKLLFRIDKIDPLSSTLLFRCSLFLYRNQ